MPTETVRLICMIDKGEKLISNKNGINITPLYFIDHQYNKGIGTGGFRHIEYPSRKNQEQMLEQVYRK